MNFTKRAAGNSLGQPLFEAAGLRWLSDGGAVTPKVIEASPDHITTTFVPEARPSAESARKLGVMLARLHASGSPWYGSPPAGYQGRGWMGEASLPLISSDSAGTVSGRRQSWGKFYSQFRIRPYLSKTFDDEERQVLESLCEVLESGALDHDEPRLVLENGHHSSRIHGDLWNGNVLWARSGPVLIDPAAQGGHAEDDLATLSTFGMPYLGEIIQSYQEVSPLSPGWEQRVDLHQMHILTVHCHLFGRSYVPRTIEAAKNSLALA